MTRKPNFLYIMVGQQRADWLGCYGHPVVKTPNIDAIAAEGTRFDEFHVATPVCMPNRASFMTGRMPSVHGLRYNGCLLSERANTFVDVLKAGGYATATIGKSHLQPFTDFEAEKLGGDLNGPIEEAWKPEPGDYGCEEPERYEDEDQFDFPTPYYGFDHVYMVTVRVDIIGNGSEKSTQIGGNWSIRPMNCRTNTVAPRRTALQSPPTATRQPIFVRAQRAISKVGKVRVSRFSPLFHLLIRITHSIRQENTGTCMTLTTSICLYGSKIVSHLRMAQWPPSLA